MRPTRRQLCSLVGAMLACVVLLGFSVTAWAEGIIVQGSVTAESPDTGSYSQLEGGAAVTTPESERPEAPTGPGTEGGTTVGDDDLDDEDVDGDFEVPEDWECTDIGGGVEYCEPPEDSEDSERSVSCGVESEGCSSSNPSDLGAGALFALLLIALSTRRRGAANG